MTLLQHKAIGHHSRADEVFGQHRPSTEIAWVNAGLACNPSGLMCSTDVCAPSGISLSSETSFLGETTPLTALSGSVQ